MNNSDDFWFDDSDSFLGDKEIEKKVNFCKNIIDAGTLISNIDTVEETVHLCLEYGFFEEGLLLSEAVLEIAPYRADVWQARGIFLNNSFEFEEAYFSFQNAMAYNPIDCETLLNKAVAEENLGLLDDAFASLEAALIADPENEDTHFSLGGLCLKKGDVEQAIFYFEKALELDDTFADAWYELGVCYDTSEQFEKSLLAYDKYLEIEPYNHLGWFNRGIVLIEMGRFEQAVNSYELTLAIKENFPSAWFNLGVCYLSLKKYPLAIDSFKKVISDDAKDEAAWFHLGKSFEEMNNFADAVEAFNKAIEIDGEYYEAFLSRGFCFEKLNKSILAIHDFDKAMSILGSFDKEFEIDFPSNQLNEAIYKYNENISINPNDFDSWIILGELFYNAGNYEKALNAYYNYLNLVPANANAYYGIAKVNFLLHNVEEAIKILKLAFSIDPSTKQKFENEYPAVKISKLFNKLIDDTSK